MDLPVASATRDAWPAVATLIAALFLGDVRHGSKVAETDGLKLTVIAPAVG
jgi:hypothetical protein